MKYASNTLALTATIAISASAAFAGPHPGGGGGMGGAGLSGPHAAMPMSSAAPASSPTTQKSPAHATGQPSQSCQAASNYPADTPGNSFNAPGSAFDPNGVADSKYAGTQPQNSKNSASVAQYDVACTHQK